MKTSIGSVRMLGIALALVGVTAMAQEVGVPDTASPVRPKGPCDIYAAAGDPCVAAHSTTRALYASYSGPLYEVVRQSDGKALDIGVVQPVASPVYDPGGYADAAAQDAFCANTYCWITKIYDQSPKHNDLTQAPRGGFSGPATGGFNNVPIADMATITVMGHKVYGVFIEPGMGLRIDDTQGTAVDDQAEGQYWVINGQHYNSGCCFDYGNAEIDSRDDDNGTMETAYFGNAASWYHGNPPGPWVMTDQENNLVGCVNPDGSKLCVRLPNVSWRFVTAIAKGEPHHWTTLGGNAQQGGLSVMFDGPRVNSTYDPMRKQGAILLGNGGDNSNRSQGTFYEGAMTAAGTFPSDATDQKVQANIVAAGYGVQRLSLAPASTATIPPGLQTFSPGSSQEATLTFTNTTGVPAESLQLSLQLPNRQWISSVVHTTGISKKFPEPVPPGATALATFKITSGPEAFNGDLVGHAQWTNPISGRTQSEMTSEKARNVSPIRINEFRIGSGPPANVTDSFIELYNAGSGTVDISNWTLTERPAQQAIFSRITIPAGTKLAAGRFYLFGLSNSALAAQAHAGDTTIHVRSVTGMQVGDTISIGTGSSAETRRIAGLGTAAASSTTVWQPLPDGLITIPAGSTNVPVTSISGFVAGQKVGLGYGSSYPTVPEKTEQYEVGTVSAVGKPGTQAYLAADAPAGATNIQVTSVENISVGDTIRLDINSLGHGIETVSITNVGTAAYRTKLAARVKAGATIIKVRSVGNFTVGNLIAIGTPANLQKATITNVGTSGPNGTGLEVTPALSRDHAEAEDVLEPGTGLELASPLKFSHAANLPFSDRGTGISFRPATAFVHMSNEPVQPLGTGITLDRAVARDHAINDVVRDTAATGAGYQGSPTPDQWFGGPELTTNAPFFERHILLREGSMVLRNALGLVVDSLNYGGLVDPWAAEGNQAGSGFGESGCYVPAPGLSTGLGPLSSEGEESPSSGRFPDGADSDSNCTDFLTTPATTMSASATLGATSIKVSSVEGFEAGQTIRIDAGGNLETAVIAEVGSAGAARLRSATTAGATVIPVSSARSFSLGETISIGSGADFETAVIVASGGFRSANITVATPLTVAHEAGAEVSGTGVILTAPLSHEHHRGALVTGSLATPGAPNNYYKRPH